ASARKRAPRPFCRVGFLTPTIPPSLLAISAAGCHTPRHPRSWLGGYPVTDLTGLLLVVRPLLRAGRAAVPSRPSARRRGENNGRAASAGTSPSRFPSTAGT